MKLKLFTVACIGLLCAFSAPNLKLKTTSDFVLVETTKKISLYEKWYEISKGKQARELKAEFTIEANIAEIETLLQNEAKGTLWNSKSKTYKIKDNTKTAWVNYIEYALPWPMDNQDCVLKYSKSSMGAVASIVSFASSVHASFPEKKDISRIPNVKGKWILTQSGNTTKVVYHITTSPSTTLPRVVTDPIVHGNIISTLAAFRDLLE